MIEKTFRGTLICNVMVVLILFSGMFIVLFRPESIEPYKSFCEGIWPFMASWMAIMGGVKGFKSYNNRKATVEPVQGVSPMKKEDKFGGNEP